jgi:hypothetical protein
VSLMLGGNASRGVLCYDDFIILRASK